MSASVTKICNHCKELFTPSRSCRNRQCYCSKSECRKASARASQQRWLRKPENQNYFRGEEHADRVRSWRANNPGYWRRTKRRTLQETENAQVIEIAENNAPAKELYNRTLQDIEKHQVLVIVGLISVLTGSTLQEELAKTSSNLIQAAHEMLKGGSNDKSVSDKASTSQRGAPAI